MIAWEEVGTYLTGLAFNGPERISSLKAETS